MGQQPMQNLYWETHARGSSRSQRSAILLPGLVSSVAQLKTFIPANDQNFKAPVSRSEGIQLPCKALTETGCWFSRIPRSMPAKRGRQRSLGHIR